MAKRKNNPKKEQVLFRFPKSGCYIASVKDGIAFKWDKKKEKILKLAKADHYLFYDFCEKFEVVGRLMVEIWRDGLSKDQAKSLDNSLKRTLAGIWKECLKERGIE